MVDAGAAGIVAMTKMLAEAKVAKPSTEPFHCFSDGIVRLMKARPALKGPSTLISARVVDELKALSARVETADGKNESAREIELAQCAARLQGHLPTLTFDDVAVAGHSRGEASLDYGPFCQ